MAHLAEMYSVQTGCHGATDLSPVTMAAALHFGLSVHNFGFQEHMPHSQETDKVFPHAYRSPMARCIQGNGRVSAWISTKTWRRRTPYQRAYLPVARLDDGTVHSW